MIRTYKFNKFLIIALGFLSTCMASIGFLFWQILSPEEKTQLINLIHHHTVFIFLLIISILAGFLFFLTWIFKRYILPISNIADETSIIHSTNPSHRLGFNGSSEIKRLVKVINHGADQYEAHQKKVQDMIKAAMTDADTEIRTLAAVMAELTAGIIICNSQGKILLYNNSANYLLTGSRSKEEETKFDPQDDTGPESSINEKGKFMGLGRSVFRVIDKELIDHALEEISEKLSRKDTDVAAYFVITMKNNKLLRVEAIPILDNAQQFTGFAIIMREITQQMSFNRQIGSLLQSLTTDVRASLASIQAAIETILNYPLMTSKQLNRFRQIIHKEVMVIGNILDKSLDDHSGHIHKEWPLVEMLAHNLMKNIRKKSQDSLDISIVTREIDNESWIRVDSYSMIASMLFLIQHLHKETGQREFGFAISKKDNVVCLDLDWKGDQIPLEILHVWEKETLVFENYHLPLTLEDVKKYHELELWSFTRKQNDNLACLRMMLPAVQVAARSETVRHLTVLPDSRSEFYEFNLFEQPGQKTELDNRLLTELSFTVFDTETTGLDPSHDEIISIGAVRIINNRILKNENFSQLIDPKRSIPKKSIKIHGIHPETIKGKPTVETVLPLFHRYCGETILLAHNAAFDMRMFQMKEEVCGTTFINPLLDTLLLSEVLHPTQKSHDIENISVRLGVNIFGRHTALGDAMMTAEMFLKMIPLLAQQNIYTLKEAREAAKKSYYARLKY